MMLTILFAVGLLIEAGLLAFAIVRTLQERSALKRLVQDSGTLDELQSAISKLPKPHQEIASEFAESIGAKTELDAALTSAVVGATGRSFRPSLFLRVVAGFLVATAMLAPVAYALLEVAGQIQEAELKAGQTKASVLYLQGQNWLDTGFANLREAFQYSALLLTVLMFVWTLSWWLQRPAAREAQLVRALLESASKLQPSSGAPISGRLAELIAPERNFRRPITAMVICMVSVTLGWGVLYQTAGVRASNVHAPVYDVWPKSSKLKQNGYKQINPLPGVVLPTNAAGVPVPLEILTLHLGRNRAQIADVPLAKLTDYKLPQDWRKAADGKEIKALEAYKKRRLDPTKAAPLSLNVAADSQAPMATLIDLLTYFHTKHKIEHFYLVQERTVRLDKGTEKMQAVLHLQFGSGTPGKLSLKLGSSQLQVGSQGASLAPSKDWRAAIRTGLHNVPEAINNTQPIRVTVDPAQGYRNFMRVLSMADSTCASKADCGLPGLGMRFVLDTGAAQ